MRICVALLPIAALCLALASGCGPAKLNEEKTLSVDSGEAKAIELAAQKKPQKITVEFESSKGEVEVLVFKTADAPGEDGLLVTESTKALEKKTGKSGTFSVDIPENTATRVVVRNASAKTDVKLKVTNKQ